MAYVAVGESRIFKSTFVSQLNEDPILSKDCLTRIRVGILYMKPKLLIVANHDAMLNLNCDCGVFLFNTPKARIAGKYDRPKRLAPIKVWFVGKVYRMHRNFGNRWVEYRDPTTLMDQRSNMEIG